MCKLPPLTRRRQKPTRWPSPASSLPASGLVELPVEVDRPAQAAGRRPAVAIAQAAAEHRERLRLGHRVLPVARHGDGLGRRDLGVGHRPAPR